MHRPLAQALVMIAAAAVARDEPSSGRRLAARRGRRRPVKRETESMMVLFLPHMSSVLPTRTLASLTRLSATATGTPHGATDRV